MQSREKITRVDRHLQRLGKHLDGLAEEVTELEVIVKQEEENEEEDEEDEEDEDTEWECASCASDQAC